MKKDVECRWMRRLVRRLRCAIVGHVVYPCDYSGKSLMRRTDEGVEAECDHCGQTIKASCGLELCGLVWCRKPNNMPESQSSPRDERAIEKQVTNYAIKQGCYVRKFTASTRRYVPDCIFITPQGKAFFIEFKKRGGLATVQKNKEIKLLRKVNVEVYVVDSVEKGIQIVDDQTRAAKDAKLNVKGHTRRAEAPNPTDGSPPSYAPPC